jgi:L-alanine-DL-glutamate epimerase-like enolase superfamily enzyme
MDPKKQVMRLKKHLKSKGFSDVKIKIFHGEAAARTSSSEPFVAQVKAAADKSFGKSILNVSNNKVYLFDYGKLWKKLVKTSR